MAADNVPHSNTIVVELDDRTDLNELLEKVQRIMVERTLRESRGNVTEAARHLGISRPRLYDLMSRYGLRRDWRRNLLF